MSNGGPPIIDDAPRLRVVRVHINDWVASTRGMSLDEEGFFWRFTCLFYDRMGDLPDDDRIVSRAMNLDIRAYKHMKARMVSLGKISVAGGRLSNARAEREISAYVAEYRRRSEAAKQREENKRSASQDLDATQKIGTDFDATSVSKSDRSRIEVGSKLAGLRLDTEADLSEKDREIKGSDATTLPQGDHSPHARARPKPKPKPLLSEDSPHTPPQGGQDPIEVLFDEFWQAFPAGRKQAKGEARDAFRRIVTGKHRKGLKAKADVLIAAAKRYAAARPDPEFTPMPSTWLNGGRWEDEATAAAVPAPVDGRAWGWWVGKESLLSGLPIQRWRDAIAKEKPNGTWPWWVLGAPPGHPECVVPQSLVDEFGYVEIYRGQIHHV